MNHAAKLVKKYDFSKFTIEWGIFVQETAMGDNRSITGARLIMWSVRI